MLRETAGTSFCILTVLFCLWPPVTQAQVEADAKADSAYASLILEAWSRHPLMELPDLYKFVHQSAMGPGHAVTDTAAVRSWMDREIATLHVHEDHQEQTVALLRPDSALIRVNLRPYLAAGGDPESLLQAFISTANGFRTSKEELERNLSIVVNLVRSGRLAFHPDSAEALIDSMAARGFPAVHHSSAYTEAYRPAYRVVQRGQLAW